MKSKSRKSFFNLATALTYKLIVIVVGLILPRLFIMSYGSELNGLRDSAKQLFTYIALLESGVGASILQSLYKPTAEEDHTIINSYLSAASVYYNRIGLLYFIALGVLGVIYAFTVEVAGFSKQEVILYFLISGALTGINFFYLAKLKLLINAEGDQYIVSLITMVTYIVSSAAKIILIYCSVHVIAVEGMFLLINLGSTGVYWLIAKKKYPWMSFRAAPDYTCTQQKGSVMIHRITSVIFQNTDVVLLTFFCNLKVVSIYGMYKMVLNMVTSIVAELGNSIHFMLGQTFNTEGEDKQKYCTMIDVFNVFYSSIAFALYTVAYILILPFLRLYTEGMDINYIYGLLPLLYLIVEFLTVGREAMIRTIEVAGHFKKTQYKAVIEAVINLGSSILFILIGKHFLGDIGGIYGVLAGTILALFYRTIDINLYANRQILHRRSFKTFSVMLINIIVFIGVFFISSLVQLKINGYADFMFHGVWISCCMLVVFISIQSLLHTKESRIAYAFIEKKLKGVRRKKLLK